MILPEGVPAEKLWKDYLFITRELLKFVEKQNMDMIASLLEQRDATQAALDACAAKNDDFPGREELISEIRDKNQLIGQRLQLGKNQLQARHNRSNAYEGFTGEAARGNRGDWRM